MRILLGYSVTKLWRIFSGKLRNLTYRLDRLVTSPFCFCFYRPDRDVIILDEDAPDFMKAKYLKFRENHRPAYFGTWRKSSKILTPRNPFKKDEVSGSSMYKMTDLCPFINVQVKPLTFLFSIYFILSTNSNNQILSWFDHCVEAERASQMRWVTSECRKNILRRLFVFIYKFFERPNLWYVYRVSLTMT